MNSITKNTKSVKEVLSVAYAIKDIADFLCRSCICSVAGSDPVWAFFIHAAFVIGTSAYNVYIPFSKIMSTPLLKVEQGKESQIFATHREHFEKLGFKQQLLCPVHVTTVEQDSPTLQIGKSAVPNATIEVAIVLTINTKSDTIGLLIFIDNASFNKALTNQRFRITSVTLPQRQPPATCATPARHSGAYGDDLCIAEYRKIKPLLQKRLAFAPTKNVVELPIVTAEKSRVSTDKRDKTPAPPSSSTLISSLSASLVTSSSTSSAPTSSSSSSSSSTPEVPQESVTERKKRRMQADREEREARKKQKLEEDAARTAAQKAKDTEQKKQEEEQERIRLQQEKEQEERKKAEAEKNFNERARLEEQSWMQKKDEMVKRVAEKNRQDFALLQTQLDGHDDVDVQTQAIEPVEFTRPAIEEKKDDSSLLVPHAQTPDVAINSPARSPVIIKTLSRHKRQMDVLPAAKVDNAQALPAEDEFKPDALRFRKVAEIRRRLNAKQAERKALVGTLQALDAEIVNIQREEAAVIDGIM
jgi:hypothetical protein